MPASHIPSRYESALVQKPKQGDGNAFEAIFYHYSQPLIEVAKVAIKLDLLVDDVVPWTGAKILQIDPSIEDSLLTCLKNPKAKPIRVQRNITQNIAIQNNSQTLRTNLQLPDTG